MQKIIKFLTDILFYLFRQVSTEIKKLNFVAQGPLDDQGKQLDPISPQDRITDFLEVFRPTRLFFIFNILAFIIFLKLPQGKDIILLVIEDLSRFHAWSLFTLLAGVGGWAILAEFGARYKIYISDNSGKSLSASRVVYRKQLQSLFSMIYLLLPYVVVLLSVVFVSFGNIAIKDWNSAVAWPFITVIVLLILSAAGLARFYLDDNFNTKLRKNRRWRWATRILKLPDNELNWLNKLYGIYNDYVYTIRKETVFTDDNPKGIELKAAYKKFIGIVKSFPPEEFPDDLLLPTERAPVEFRPPIHIDEEYKPDFTVSPFSYNQVNPAGSYRWTYLNNPRFYKILHKQVKIIFFSSFIVLLLISFNFFLPYNLIGSPGLVCFSFGCWQGAYTGLLYFDYRFRKKTYISARWLLLIWFFIVSYIDSDHPVRYNEEGKVYDSRLGIKDHFSAWLRHHKADTANTTWWENPQVASLNPKDTACKAKDTSRNAKDTPLRKLREYPVIFITAEGGALRTGAFTAMFLAAMQDSFPQFRNDIYAFSSVSGGSVGVSFFNAVNYLEVDTEARYTAHYYRRKTREFFQNDQLSPVIAKMFYGDNLNYLWPWHVEKLDRAVSLEKAWEHDYAKLFNKRADENVYSENYLSLYNMDSIHPAWFINTTEVETGLQCFISNARPDKTTLFAGERDLLHSKIRGGINYSTAVGFSTRFPLFSPSAAIRQNDDRIYHYVDGGYVENTGAKTMLELLQSLRDSTWPGVIRPYVIQLRFGSEDEFSSTSFLNEINSIGSGIYNIRAGYSMTYTSLLKAFTEETLKGKFMTIPLELSSDEVPMSWVFSERSLDNLTKAVDSIMKYPKNELHRKLYLFDSTLVKKPKK